MDIARTTDKGYVADVESGNDDASASSSEASLTAPDLNLIRANYISARENTPKVGRECRELLEVVRQSVINRPNLSKINELKAQRQSLFLRIDEIQDSFDDAFRVELITQPQLDVQVAETQSNLEALTEAHRLLRSLR